MKNHINFFKDYLLDTYGESLYKIPLDLNSGCPNRKKSGKGGCSFCAENGARSMQTMNSTSVMEQIFDAKKFAKKRYGAKKFMLYIQAFTANFNKKYQKIYNKLISEEFKAVSFGTRPDSLNASSYKYLKKINKKIDVWIELGVQTVHNKTLKKINRGHNWSCSKNAIRKLHSLNLKVAVHVILGLPGETEKDMLKTAEKLSKLPIDAIKIHNLHVLKGTKLEKEYKKSPFSTLSEYEYIDLLIKFLRNIRKDIHIIRMTTESIKEDIIAPNWKMNKSHFKEYVLNKMKFENVFQGDKFKKNKFQIQFDQKYTMDGSLTYWSNDFKEHFHDKAGAILEAEHKFLKPANLNDKNNIKVLDICFGLGYNSLVTLDYAILNKKNIEITGIEIDKRVVHNASKHIISNKVFNWNKCLKTILQDKEYKVKQSRLSMLWGDARNLVTKLSNNYYDVIFLDAFSSQHNSELWTLDFFLKLKKIISKKGVLITYSSAIPIRHALQQAGFYVGETPPLEKERGGTIASLTKSNILQSLPEKDLELFKTTRGVVYRDPYNIWPNKEILRQREFSIKVLKNKKFDIL